MIESLISEFANAKLVSFLRSQNSSFVDYEEDLSDIVSDFKKFGNLIKLGEIEYDNTDKLMVFTCKYQGELTSRSSKKAQYEIAKKALKEDFQDGAVFVFYDQAGRFRFSFIRRNYGDKNQKFTPWKRYTYFVEPDAKTNRTFIERIGTCNFDSLDNIQQAFSVEKLTKDFYKELSDWYFWAIKNVSFPNDIADDSDNEKYNSENIIRLITRLIFVWFLKQKGLIRNELFEPKSLSEILIDFDAESDTQNNYYRAILQNLFFATLNQEIDKRGFAEDKGFLINRDNNTIKNLYRYEKEFHNNTTQIMELFSQVPFLNGGLFECLDRKEKDGKVYDWDGFSRNPKFQAKIPNSLFFAKENKVDLSGEYNDKKMKAVKVAGIIEILNRYNFTIEENTPVEVEVALDPELLGKVFENLLGAFNPETQETARKQTGSFYTPREIVHYMVDESLIAYFITKVPEVEEEILRQLISYDDVEVKLSEKQSELLINAIFNCKILDPATGSGAFPMGILQQIVHILRKLDYDNEHWNNVVMTQAMKDFEKAEKLSDDDKEYLIEEIEKTFDDGLNYPDYARKLHVIENCIYGVDIQSIAIQITKLRFFISLVCEQRKGGDATNNFGIRPLPNLETKFVAANTLVGLEKTEEDLELFNDDKIKTLIDKLQHVRHRLFLVTNSAEKKRLQDKDQKLREEIEHEVSELYKKHKDENKTFYERQKSLAEKELQLIDKTVERSAVSTNIFGEVITKTYKPNNRRKKELEDTIRIATKKIEEASDYSRLGAVVALARQLTSWNPYDQNDSSPFFDPEWMFGLPKQDEGYFDLVIGNPPYVEISDIPKEFRVIYSKLFITAKGRFDLYILFLEQAMAIKNFKGGISFIIPGKFLNNKQFAESRKIISKAHDINVVKIDDKVFEAQVDSVIIHNCSAKDILNPVYKSFKISEKHLTFLSESEVNQILNDNISIFTLEKNKDTDLILDKIKSNKLIIKNIAEVKDGIVAGSLKDILFINNKIDNCCHKLFFGKNISRFSLSDTDVWVNYKPDEMMKIEKLRQGEKRIGLWMRDEKIFKREKIIYRKVGKEIIATIDEKGGVYYEQTIHSCHIKDKRFLLKYILAVFNSNLIKYFYHKTNSQGGNIFPQIRISSVENIPVKQINQETQKRIVRIVDNILEYKKVKQNHDTSDFEQQLDNIVYRLYDLTYDEVKVIDPDIESKISEVEYNAIIID